MNTVQRNVSLHFEKAISLVSLTLALLALPSIVFADSRLDTGSLPTTLVEREDCQLTDSYPWGGWGWDGEKTCKVTNLRFFGTDNNLTGTDAADNSLTWENEAVVNQTLRCDSYQLRQNFTARVKEYKRSRYDITILSDNMIPAGAVNEDLNDVTAHLHTRGFETGRTGILIGAGALVNFKAGAFLTEKGYLFIDDRGERNSDGDYIIEKFSHCWLRDHMYPLRASSSCIDNDGDGIGWNGFEECSIEPGSECDYTHAAFNRGWGYDQTTSQACPPQSGSTAYIPEDICVRSGSDGWGWNEARQESCRL